MNASTHGSFRALRGLFAFFGLFWTSLCLAQTQLPFFDDFSRPDNSAVGNGWSNVAVPAPNTGGSLELLDGKATLATPDVFAGIYRPVDFSGPLTVTATFSQTSGFGGTLNRYGNSIVLSNDGTFLNGYVLNFYRGDQNYNNSTVSLAVGDSTQVGSLASSFQFGAAINVTATFYQDGSIQGTVSDENNNSFAFSFGPYAFAPTFAANDVQFLVSGPDSRSAVLTDPTIDDIAISEIPEPSAYAAILGAAALGLVAIRRQPSLKSPSASPAPSSAA
jgi:hypothetical protein